eukprot:scaffold330500_cov59-Tisochrysis_lutea.AAC.3
MPARRTTSLFPLASNRAGLQQADGGRGGRITGELRPALDATSSTSLHGASAARTAYGCRALRVPAMARHSPSLMPARPRAREGPRKESTE